EGQADGLGHADGSRDGAAQGLGDHPRRPAAGAVRRASGRARGHDHRAGPLCRGRAAGRGSAAAGAGARRRQRAPRVDHPGAGHARGSFRPSGRSRVGDRSLRRAVAGRGGGRCAMSGVSLPTVVRIAANVFKESVRDKVLYSIVLFAVLIIAASLLIGQLTAGQEVKIIKDLGLSAISLFGHFIAIFIGIGLVSKEIERRSIYALLAKPMSRTELLVGKFLGLVATLAVNVTVMTAALALVLAVFEWMTPADLRAAWEASATDPGLRIRP